MIPDFFSLCDASAIAALFPEGQRVRIVHRESYGTIAGPPEVSPLDGTWRIPVRWDVSGNVTRQCPAFLMPADQLIADDPFMVVGAGFALCALFPGEICRIADVERLT